MPVLTRSFHTAINLRTILPLILTNSEVRKLLSDFSLIEHDLITGDASKATETVRPDQDALAHVDETAPQDQITEDGRTVSPNETPVVEAKMPGTGAAVAQHPREELGKGAVVKGENGEVTSGEQVYRKGNAGTGCGCCAGTDRRRTAVGVLYLVLSLSRAHYLLF
jgi:hypothetical protein